MHAVQHTITDDRFRHGWDALFATATEGVMHVPEQYDKIFPHALAISVICLTKALEVGVVSSMVIARIRYLPLKGQKMETTAVAAMRSPQGKSQHIRRLPSELLGPSDDHQNLTNLAKMPTRSASEFQ